MIVFTRRSFSQARFASLWVILTLILAACNSSPNDGNLLVWVGAGPAAEQRTPSTAGQVAYLNSDGSLRTVLDLPINVAGVIQCGNQATSPDGRHFTFFTSAPMASQDSGTLYQVTGAGQPTRVRDIQGLTCAGNGALRYSPNSQRLAFIDYAPVSERAEFAVGTLRLYNAGRLTEDTRFENVTSFDLRNDSLAYLSLFTNARGAADEAAVVLWDGQNADEIATLYPEQGCRFTSGQIAMVQDARIVALMGQRCPSGDTRTRWQFYNIDRAARTATLAVSDYQAGGYFPYTRTNNLIVSNDGSTVLFTPADGLGRNTTRIVAVNMSSISAENITLRSGAVMPTWTPFRFSLPVNAAPALSPDGRWLAMVISDGAATSLGIVDLNNAAQPPVQIPLPDGGDAISYLEFSQDSAVLYFVARGRGGADNAVFRVEMATLDESRLQRGSFGGGVVAPDAAGVALVQYRRTEGARVLNYVDLVYVKDDRTEPVTLYTGLQTNDSGQPVGAQFIYPLSWRK